MRVYSEVKCFIWYKPPGIFTKETHKMPEGKAAKSQNWKIVLDLLVWLITLALALVGLHCIMGRWFARMMQWAFWIYIAIMALLILFGWRGKLRMR